MNTIQPIDGTSSDRAERVAAIMEVIRARSADQEALRAPQVEKDRESAFQERREPERGQAAEPPRLMETYAEWEFDEESQEVTVRIVDARSGKLVRTIPAEELFEEIMNGSSVTAQLRRRNLRV